ncbi:Conserved_hypothetical protein [Hexamita inflata]|uniref:Uncharacterized protein n=1 Tax=Hexamita inflata TaxID=28002 RepID=A0AA86UFX6_9EUKA|nr:Conserved hypothetical protein [Hexamita inflata]
MNSSGKNIYQTVIGKPRLFAEQDYIENERAMQDQSRNEIKFKQYMDRAYMDLERTNQQLMRTRADLQNAGKILNEKDAQLFQLQEQIQNLQMHYDQQLLELKQSQEKQMQEREIYLKKRFEEKMAQRDEDFKLQLEQTERNIQLQPISETQKQKIFRDFHQKLIQKQQKLKQERKKHSFPQSHEEVLNTFSIKSPYKQTTDFLSADQAELAESVQNYYKTLNLELKTEEAEELIDQVLEYKVEEETTLNMSGVEKVDDGDISISEIQM